MNSNSPWTLITDAPPPDGEDVLVYLAQKSLGSRYAVYSSQKISNGYMVTINGLFKWDFDVPILAWRQMKDLEDELPIELTEKDRPA